MLRRHTLAGRRADAQGNVEPSAARCRSSHLVGNTLEIASGLARRERENLLTADEVSSALSKARLLADSWHEVVPSDAVRRTAERLLRSHPLRAADSLQLAAALIAADHDASLLELVSLDVRLNTAARREGFKVLDG